MVRQSSQGDLLLKHYQNLCALSKKQFAAITEDQLLVVEDFIAQKEMLICEIKKWHEYNKISDCSLDVIEKFRQIICEILASEENSQKLLTEQQEQVRKAMVVKQKSKIIQQAYEGQSFPQY